MRRLRSLFLLLALSACTLSACTLTGGGSKGVAPLETEAIAVTSLDAPESAAASAQPEAKPETAAKPEAAPEPVAEPAPEPVAETAPEPAPEPPPEVAAPLTPAAIACGKGGGRFVSVAKGAGSACVRRTRDAGKACRKETDCDGRCLARSRTCSPIDPLFGCNEILQANGTRVTLCLD